MRFAIGIAHSDCFVFGVLINWSDRLALLSFAPGLLLTFHWGGEA